MNALIAGEPRFTPSIVADKTVGLTLAYALIAALFYRERTGQGQFVEVPMFETMASFVMLEHLWGKVYDRRGGVVGYPRITHPLRKPYKTRDGHLCVLPYSNRNWQDFVRAAGRPDLADDPRFASPESRNRNGDAVYGLMAELLATKSSSEWMKLLLEKDVPVARMNSPESLLDDEHLDAVGLFAQFEHPTEGRVTHAGPPVLFSRTPAQVRSHAPLLGEHGEALLREAGMTKSEIREALGTPESASE